MEAWLSRRGGPARAVPDAVLSQDDAIHTRRAFDFFVCCAATRNVISFSISGSGVISGHVTILCHLYRRRNGGTRKPGGITHVFKKLGS